MPGGVCVRLMILTRSLGGSPTAALFHDSRRREHQCASCARHWPRTPRVSTKQTSSSLLPLFLHAHHYPSSHTRCCASRFCAPCSLVSLSALSRNKSDAQLVSPPPTQAVCSPVTCHAFNLLSFLTLGTCMLQHRVSVNKDLEPRG